MNLEDVIKEIEDEKSKLLTCLTITLNIIKNDHTLKDFQDKIKDIMNNGGKNIKDYRDILYKEIQ